MRICIAADAHGYMFMEYPHAVWARSARAPHGWPTGRQRKVRLLGVPPSSEFGAAWLKCIGMQVAMRSTAPLLGALQQVSQKDRDAPSPPLTITAKLISSIESVTLPG